jgi:hypothetical protein
MVNIIAGTPAYYSVAFYVCGLPAGVSASFSPPIAPSTPDVTPVSNYSARSTLSLSTPWTVHPGQYTLAIRGAYLNAQHQPTGTGPSGNLITPQTVLMTVQEDGSVSLVSSPIPVATEGMSCTSLPAEASVTATATPSATDVQIAGSISNANPAAGEPVTVTGTIKVRGMPVDAVTMETKWYLPTGMATCFAQTDRNGTAICSMSNDHPLTGWIVQVQLLFFYNGGTYITYVAYTM